MIFHLVLRGVAIPGLLYCDYGNFSGESHNGVLLDQGDQRIGIIFLNTHGL
jgi:hypothetical protein